MAPSEPNKGAYGRTCMFTRTSPWARQFLEVGVNVSLHFLFFFGGLPHNVTPPGIARARRLWWWHRNGELDEGRGEARPYHGRGRTTYHVV